MKNFAVASSYNNYINAVTFNEEQVVKFFWNKSKCKKVWSEKPGRTGQHWVVSLVPEKKHVDKQIACEYLEHKNFSEIRKEEIQKKTIVKTNVKAYHKKKLINVILFDRLNNFVISSKVLTDKIEGENIQKVQAKRVYTSCLKSHPTIANKIKQKYNF
jgi:hypothetical protein